MDRGIFLSPDASLVKTVALKDLGLALFLGSCALQKYVFDCLSLHASALTVTNCRFTPSFRVPPHGCKSKKSSESSLGSKSEWFDLHGGALVAERSPPNSPGFPALRKSALQGPGAWAQQGGRDLNVHCRSCCARRWSLPSVSLHFTASESPSAC